ncbi:hypothetical protein IAD21_00259 [Abditibacteriota bacterium]|nr:hypothetical protein IAD21_00259 [Abditibacteriota bacterium]
MGNVSATQNLPQKSPENVMNVIKGHKMRCTTVQLATLGRELAFKAPAPLRNPRIDSGRG